MKVVPLAKPRVAVFEKPGEVRITISGQRNWLTIALGGLWLCAWLFGVVSAIRVIGWSLSVFDLFYMLAWLTAWTATGGIALYGCGWNLAGREVILLKPNVLVLRWEIFGLGRSKSFERAPVQGVRSSAANSGTAHPFSLLRSLGIGSGAVAFDYGPKTYRFGDRLHSAEAEELVRVLKGQLESRER